MTEKCGLCGSKNIGGGSWSPDRCLDCGAIESIRGEWYMDGCSDIERTERNKEQHITEQARA